MPQILIHMWLSPQWFVSWNRIQWEFDLQNVNNQFASMVVVVTDLPRGLGISSGIFSLTFPYTGVSNHIPTQVDKSSLVVVL